MRGKARALFGALVFAVCTTCGDAAANDYNVVIVSVDRLTESFFNGDLQGTYEGSVTTSNLPGPLNQVSGSYTQVLPNAIGGIWTLSDGGKNAIGGNFEMQNRMFSSGLAPTSGIIILDPTAGKGTFLGATGGGTFEAYTRDAYDPVLNQFYIQRISITRLQVTADGLPQTDTRPVTVSSRVGINNDNTHHGVNIGVPTSDSNPMIVNSVRSEYDYSSSPTHGESFNKNDTGDSEHWSFVVDPNSGQDMGSFLIHYYGTATFLDGTGVFAGAAGSSEWESFEVGTGPVGPNVWGHAVVSIDRYTFGLVPEPQTYMLMLAGLGMVGALARRRRNSL
jgi:hypothetical protein